MYAFEQKKTLCGLINSTVHYQDKGLLLTLNLVKTIGCYIYNTYNKEEKTILWSFFANC